MWFTDSLLLTFGGFCTPSGRHSSESGVLSTIKRDWLQFVANPSLSPVPIPVSLPNHPEKRQVWLEQLHNMLRKGAVEIVDEVDPGFCSHLFAVTKKSWGWRPVIDLKTLNRLIVCPHFRMETAQSIRSQLQISEWVVSVDLSDAYYHLLVHPMFSKFLRVHMLGTTFQFGAMCFALCTAPLMVTRVMKVIVHFLRSRSIEICILTTGWSGR